METKILLQVIQDQINFCEENKNDLTELVHWIELKKFITSENTIAPSEEALNSTVFKLNDEYSKKFNELLEAYTSELDAKLKSDRDKDMARFIPELKKIKLARKQLEEFLKDFSKSKEIIEEI